MKTQTENITIVPKVSIPLPTLNTRRFLEERVQTILNQTFTDWEVIVVDGYSDDGTWELIKNFANKDSRIRILQVHREGIYAGINNCLKLARGEYIYIATSDDTMTPDCLEKMVAALETHPECDICHCCLKLIDENGNETPNKWPDSRPGQFYGELMTKPHIRMAPYDGILHCVLYTVYSSLTQLLIRRSLFDKIGLFRTDWGSIGDFEWGMRASLVCNTFHLPKTLATWRRHPEQATANFILESSAAHASFCRMIKASLPILQRYNPDFFKKLAIRRLLIPYRRKQLLLGLRERREKLKKVLFLLRFLFVSPSCVGEFICIRFFGILPRPDDFIYIRGELKRLGLEHNIKVLKSYSTYEKTQNIRDCA